MATCLRFGVVLMAVTVNAAYRENIDEREVGIPGKPLRRSQCQSLLKTSETWDSCHVAQRFRLPVVLLTQPDQMRALGHHVCAEVKPKAYSCFEAKVRSCSNKNMLLNLARSTGGFCGQSDFLPWVYEVLSKVQLPYNVHLVHPNQTNTVCQDGMIHSYIQCTEVSSHLEASVFSKGFADNLQDKTDAYMESFYSCLLSRYRQAVQGGDRLGFGRCPPWEMKAILIQAYLTYIYNDQLGFRITPLQIQRLIDALDQ